MFPFLSRTVVFDKRLKAGGVGPDSLVKFAVDFYRAMEFWNCDAFWQRKSFWVARGFRSEERNAVKHADDEEKNVQP